MQRDQTAIDVHDGGRALSSSPNDRRLSSDEWGESSLLCPANSSNRTDKQPPDASKVPPSRFQKRKGSIYATPGSRDGHVDRNYAQEFHDKHTAKGYGKKKSTSS